MKLTFAIALSATLMAAPSGLALAPPAGPVATACKEDIAKLCGNLTYKWICSGLPHQA